MYFSFSFWFFWLFWCLKKNWKQNSKKWRIRRRPLFSETLAFFKKKFSLWIRVCVFLPWKIWKSSLSPSRTFYAYSRRNPKIISKNLKNLQNPKFPLDGPTLDKWKPMIKISLSFSSHFSNICPRENKKYDNHMQEYSCVRVC